MDNDTEQQPFMTNPPPPSRYNFSIAFSVALFFEPYEAAVHYYTEVLGPPAYVEGGGTHSWRIGPGWLTLLKWKSGKPQNVELIFQLDTPADAEQLQQAFITAGGQGPAPSDQIMHEPVRYCPVQDPFGTNLLIISPLNSIAK